jgi:serpin B
MNKINSHKPRQIASMIAFASLIFVASSAVVAMQGRAVETDSAAATDSTDQGRAPVVGERFARDLLAQLRGSDNLAISPASIESCALLALGGARGQTAKQMAAVLHLPNNSRQEVGTLLDRIQRLAHGGDQKTNAAALVIANSAWIDKSLPVNESFEKLLKANDRATLLQVDFVRQTEDARKDINAWVDTATRGKIAQLLAPGVLDDSSRLVLVNAIYFKGGWLLPFKKENSRRSR